MKISILVLCVALSTNAWAQETTTNGYDSLVEAGKLILPGENGGASSTETNLSPAENLRRERVAVARNTPALRKLREALHLPIDEPLREFGADPFSSNARFRELARQLSQESDVRAADGDFVGALSSRLDCIEMGVAVSRGAVISMLVGGAIESIGRREIEKFAAQVDESAARNAAARLAKIEARRPSFVDVLKSEEQQTFNSNLAAVNDSQKNDWISRAERLQNNDNSDLMRAVLKLSPETLKSNNARLFGGAIQNAALPFQRSRAVELPRDLDVLTIYSRQTLGNPNLRFSHERNATENELLRLALELRAERFQNGVYPRTFPTPTDRFSPDLKPLNYRSDGQTYALYSVGPDGRDDKARPFNTRRFRFDPTTGTQREIKPYSSARLESKGDILASIF